MNQQAVKKAFSAHRLPGRQTGASFFAMIIILVLIGFIILAGLRILPAYTDNRIIVSTMERMDTENDLSTMTLAEIRSSLARTLRTNGIREFDTGNVQLLRENNVDYVAIDYESRAPIFYNIEAVMTFSERFER